VSRRGTDILPEQRTRKLEARKATKTQHKAAADDLWGKLFGRNVSGVGRDAKFSATKRSYLTEYGQVFCTVHLF
jgi:hypothetical protein